MSGLQFSLWFGDCKSNWSTGLWLTSRLLHHFMDTTPACRRCNSLRVFLAPSLRRGPSLGLPSARILGFCRRADPSPFLARMKTAQIVTSATGRGEPFVGTSAVREKARRFSTALARTRPSAVAPIASPVASRRNHDWGSYQIELF